jgi:photosystem II stability/assembly factor-like uncharacterized protein
VDRTRNLRDFWIQDLSFVDASRGWALGYFAVPSPGLVTMQHTDDGGRTWQLVTAPTTEPGRAVTHVRFADARDGWAFGPALYSTHDGGSTWTRRRLGGPVLDLASAGHTVWAVAGERVWASGVRSDRWAPLNAAPRIVGESAELLRRAPGRAWLLWHADRAGAPGSSHLMASVDGGRSWTALAVPCGEDSREEDLAPSPAGVLWLLCGGEGVAGGETGSLYRSRDGGRSWKPLVPSTTFGFDNVIAPVSAFTAWLGGSSHSLLETRDGGEAWHAVLEGAGGGWRVEFTGARTGYAWEHDRLFLTFDAGRHWRPIHLTPSGCG